MPRYHAKSVMKSAKKPAKKKAVRKSKRLKVNGTEWSVDCPKCNQTVEIQPVHVTSIIIPRFKCQHCGAEGKLTQFRPKDMVQ